MLLLLKDRASPPLEGLELYAPDKRVLRSSQERIPARATVKDKKKKFIREGIMLKARE